MVMVSVVIILIGFFLFLMIPNDFMADARHVSEDKSTKPSAKSLLQAMKYPVVWFTGLGMACAYITFVGVSTYFVPFLQHSFHMTATQGGIFALANGTIAGTSAALLSGPISDKFFKNSASWMRVCYILMTAFLAFTLFLPKVHHLALIGMILLMIASFSCYLIRSVYLAPVGEYGVPNDILSTAMSITSFIGYSPSFFAYIIFGKILDSYNTQKAYQIVFIVLIVFAIFGFLCNIVNYQLIKRQQDRNAAATQDE